MRTTLLQSHHRVVYSLKSKVAVSRSHCSEKLGQLSMKSELYHSSYVVCVRSSTHGLLLSHLMCSLYIKDKLTNKKQRISFYPMRILKMHCITIRVLDRRKREPSSGITVGEGYFSMV
jgi:hypothetical protein